MKMNYGYFTLELVSDQSTDHLWLHISQDCPTWGSSLKLCGVVVFKWVIKSKAVCLARIVNTENGLLGLKWDFRKNHLRFYCPHPKRCSALTENLGQSLGTTWKHCLKHGRWSLSVHVSLYSYMWMCMYKITIRRSYIYAPQIWDTQNFVRFNVWAFRFCHYSTCIHNKLNF